MNWVGEFTCRPGTLSRCGVYVVVQTDRGIELGQQLDLCCDDHPQAVTREQRQKYIGVSGQDFCRPNAGRILREATSQDVDEHRRLNAHTQEDIRLCAQVAAEHRLDMKVVVAEHLLGGERIVFYFRAEGRIDFRDLVKDLAHRYRTRIEMRQVGARDEARLVADWEVCGRECCCRNFLKSLRPVNMKMAKLQKSTLDPAKVSGRCGRLRCCLRYENEGYQELATRLPRRGTRVATAGGEGTVVDHQVLTQLVSLRGDDGKIFTVAYEEITAFDLPKPPPPPREGETPAPPAPPPRPPAPSEPAAAEDERASRGRRRSRRGSRPRSGRRPDEAVPDTAPSAPAEGPSVSGEAPPRAPEAGPQGGTEGGETAPRPRSSRRRGRRRRRPRRDDAGGPPADASA
jgi:cell fate regulator YaaT (PSP1 superfamily)